MARTHMPIVALISDSMLEINGLSDIVWVDGRSGSQAKMKTIHAMQLKLAAHDLWHVVGHFDMKKPRVTCTRLILLLNNYYFDFLLRNVMWAVLKLM